MDYIIPPLGAKGKFKIKAPFDTSAKEDVEYVVYAIRSIKELVDDGKDPLKYIYQQVGLTETDMNKDLTENVPIIVLSGGTNNYVYVPANRITSLPDLTGVKYQQQMLAINIGHLPIDYSLEVVKETIKEAVLEMTGIESTVEAIPTSVIKYITDNEHSTYMKLLDGRKTSNMSYRTKHKILLTNYNKLKAKLDDIESKLLEKAKEAEI